MFARDMGVEMNIPNYPIFLKIAATQIINIELNKYLYSQNEEVVSTDDLITIYNAAVHEMVSERGNRYIKIIDDPKQVDQSVIYFELYERSADEQSYVKILGDKLKFAHRALSTWLLGSGYKKKPTKVKLDKDMYENQDTELIAGQAVEGRYLRFALGNEQMLHALKRLEILDPSFQAGMKLTEAQKLTLKQIYKYELVEPFMDKIDFIAENPQKVEKYFVEHVGRQKDIVTRRKMLLSCRIYPARC